MIDTHLDLVFIRHSIGAYELCERIGSDDPRAGRNGDYMAVVGAGHDIESCPFAKRPVVTWAEWADEH